MANVRFVVEVPDLSAAALSAYLRLTTGGVQQSIRSIGKFFNDFIGVTAKSGSVRVLVGAVKAVGTITFTDQPVAGEQIEVGDVVLTGLASGADEEDEWNIVSGGTAQDDANGNAAAVAALINAHSTLGMYMTAVAVLGVVTVTLEVPGLVANGVKLQEAAAGVTNCTVVGFSGGLDGTETFLDRGAS